MKSQVSKAIIRDLKRIHSLPEAKVLEILRSEFDMVSQTIESYSYDNEYYPAVRLPKFGLFFVKPSAKVNFGKPTDDEKTNDLL